MGIIAKSTIRELNERLDAVEVIGEYVRLEKRSGEYRGLCPFHTEKTPSFSVNPERKVYYCFGCGKGGTVIGFIMEIDKCSYTETVELLAKRFGVRIVYEHAQGQEEQERITRIQEIAELYRRVAGSFHYCLKERPEGRLALQYIITRGISMKMIETFRLGYAPADRRWLFQFLSHKGYSETFLASSMLFSPKTPRLSFFTHRLMFPITDHQGRTLAFGGRLLSGEGPKYVNSSESDFYKKGQTLFAIDQALGEIRKTKEVYIAEGYMDVIALHQAGITNAVAPLGTSLTDEQAKLLRRWAERVYLVFDSDGPGQRATTRAILTCRKNGLTCAVVMPDKTAGTEGTAAFKDPADILKEAGAEVLQKSVKYFMLDCEYLMFHSKSLFDISGAEGKTKAISFMFPYLEILDSDVSREIAIEQIAEAFEIDQMAIRNDFNRRHKTYRGGERENVVPKKARSIHVNDELNLLVVVLVNYRLYPEFRAKLLIKDIENPSAKELFIALEECYIHDESGMDAFLSHISSEELRNFVIERSASKEFSANPEQLMLDGIKKVRRRRLEKRRDDIVMSLRIVKHKVADIQNFPQGADLEELLAEKMHIDAQLHQL